MGTTRRYKYRIECRTNDPIRSANPITRGLMVIGVTKKPKSLKEWCEAQEGSERPGMPNEHAAKARGFLLAINSASLIRQSDHMILDSYSAPMFRSF